MRLQNLNVRALGLLSTVLVPANAYWRMSCPATLVTERLDPIVNPGKVSGHSHIILGGSAFAPTMDYAATQKSTCTSCAIDGDFSNYWSPTLYYRAQNGSFISVPIVGGGGGTVYYFPTRASYPGRKVKAFPEGFRMTAGNPEQRTSSESLAATQITHECLNYRGGGPPKSQKFPSVNCPNGIRTQVFFPSCWNEKDLDSPNHQSHMAYPSNGDSGVCPETHKQPLVSIFYEFLWDTGLFANDWYGNEQPFVLSMGDSSGYGFHGDFLNGWNVALLQSAIETCTTEDAGKASDLYSCSVLKPPKVSPQMCSIAPVVNEQISGVLPALPGCNPVTTTPQPIKNCEAVSGLSDTTSQYFTDLTTSKGWSYLGCGVDDYYNRLLTGASQDVPTMTVETCVDFCSGKGFSIAGLEYGSQCFCGNTIPASASPVPGIVGACNMACAGNGKEKCGDRSRLSLYQKCGGTCKNSGFGSTPMPDAPPPGSGLTVEAPVSDSPDAGMDSPMPSSSTPSQSTPSPSTPSSSTSAVESTGTTMVRPQNPIATASSPVAAAPAETPSSVTTSPDSSSDQASNVTLPSGWKAAGCYLDALNPRSLNGIKFAWWGELITSSGCSKYCDEQGYSFAGTENSGQCFCGNELVQSKLMAATDCKMTCRGDAGEICGGPARLSVFTKSSSMRRRSHKHRRNGHHMVAAS